MQACWPGDPLQDLYQARETPSLSRLRLLEPRTRCHMHVSRTPKYTPSTSPLTAFCSSFSLMLSVQQYRSVSSNISLPPRVMKARESPPRTLYTLTSTSPLRSPPDRRQLQEMVHCSCPYLPASSRQTQFLTRVCRAVEDSSSVKRYEVYGVLGISPSSENRELKSQHQGHAIP